LLPIPVGAPTLPCNPAAEALNATKLISCIQVEGVWLTLVAGSSSGVVLDDAQEGHEKKEFYMQPHIYSKQNNSLTMPELKMLSYKGRFKWDVKLPVVPEHLK
jgi:hypothetical protein